MIKTLLLLLLIYLVYKVYRLFKTIYDKINQINQSAGTRSHRTAPDQSESQPDFSDRIVDAEFTEIKDERSSS